MLTGHQGLANATMFTHLDQVKVGDTFSVDVLGEVFTYRVFDYTVASPHDTEEIRAVPGKDFMTRITCTPLGFNTHRILVTGERVRPTPAADLDAANKRPEVPGFPWWLVGYGAGLAAIGVWAWRSGLHTAPRVSSAAQTPPLPLKLSSGPQIPAKNGVESWNWGGGGEGCDGVTARGDGGVQRARRASAEQDRRGLRQHPIKPGGTEARPKRAQQLAELRGKRRIARSRNRLKQQQRCIRAEVLWVAHVVPDSI